MKNKETEWPSAPPIPSPRSTSVIRTRDVTFIPKTIRLDLMVYDKGNEKLLNAISEEVPTEFELRANDNGSYSLRIGGTWRFGSNEHHRISAFNKNVKADNPEITFEREPRKVWDYSNDDICFMYRELQKAISTREQIVTIKIYVPVFEMCDIDIKTAPILMRQ